MDGEPRVVEELTRRLEAQGSLGFEEVMEASLFLPGAGLYRRSCPARGSAGHFTTCARLSPALGRAIARWLLEGRRASLGGPLRWHVIELGGGDGALAEAVLEAIPRRLRLGLTFHAVERSEPALSLQRARLGDRVRLHRDVGEALEEAKGRALVYSNELVDAFPAALLLRRQGRWREIRLTADSEGRLVESTGPEPPWLLASHGFSLASLEAAPEGCRAEVHRSYRSWLRGWLPSLREGWVLTIDYGGSCEELYGRGGGGTVRAYYANQRLDEPGEAYRRLGLQDLTCDVNFTDLEAWGKAEGLTTHASLTQRQLLERYGLLEAAEPGSPLEFIARPGGAGTAFRCLWQKKT